ncbi:aminodeoxychorismate/anthranilate synthase component II [Patescibacteria group bacterium]|nr:aminodeoxychorismate/anthranilate synthase component II [Patescibacteria group bacterium]
MPKFKKILVIDNFDSFTFNLVDYFRQLEREVVIFRNTIDVDRVAEIKPDLIVFSPGPSVPKNAGNMMEIIDKYHKTIPMFGVCLGHEAFIEYFGGSLKLIEPVHGRSSEINHDGKTIFTSVEKDFMAGRYHSLVADKVPDQFDISATCDDKVSGKLVMAIRHKSLPIEGVQFHPESVLTMKGKNGFVIIENIVNMKYASL